MSDRKFYKTVFTISVISETQFSDDIDLQELHYEIKDGPSMGSGLGGDLIHSVIELSPQEVVAETIAMGGTPEFFMLNPDGTNTEDWYDIYGGI